MGHAAGVGTLRSLSVGSAAMATGTGSPSARAAPVRAKHPVRTTALPARNKRIDVAMGRQKSKRHSNNNYL